MRRVLQLEPVLHWERLNLSQQTSISLIINYKNIIPLVEQFIFHSWLLYCPSMDDTSEELVLFVRMGKVTDSNAKHTGR